MISAFELKAAVAMKIRLYRHIYRLTQEFVAEQIGINPLTYKGYEHCRSNVPLIVLVRIAELYHISLDSLVPRYLLEYADDVMPELHD